MKKSIIIVFLLLLTIIVSFFSIKKVRNPSSVVDILENHYSNFHINNSRYKKMVLSNIRKLFKADTLDLNKLKYFIQEMGDAHLYLITPKEEKLVSSGLNFHIGKKIYLANSHTSSLINFPHEVTEVDSIPIRKWIEQNKNNVTYSSRWGKNYRTLSLLSKNKEGDLLPKSLTLKNSQNGYMNLDIQWSTSSNEKCVSARKLNSDTSILEIKSLWCQLSSNENRSQILKNYKKQLTSALESIKSSTNVIIDIRDNSGGGDQETIFTLENTIPKKAFLYKYQYLNSNIPFPKNLSNRKDQIWQKKVTNFVIPSEKNNFYIGKKKIVVLINQGTFSSGEVLASVYKLGAKFKLIGKRTHGSCGNPTTWTSDDGSFKLSYPTLVLYQQDDNLYEGVGISPDINIEFSDLTEKDPYISIALKELDK